MDELRTFMFEHVYLGPAVRAEQDRIVHVMRTLFEYLAGHPESIPDGGGAPSADLPQRVVDYLAGMTDRFCLRGFRDLSEPHMAAD